MILERLPIQLLSVICYKFVSSLEIGVGHKEVLSKRCTESVLICLKINEDILSRDQRIVYFTFLAPF